MKEQCFSGVRAEPPKYSIVIPVYNSGLWLGELIARVGVVMEKEAPGEFELILVDDCSSDAVSWAAIRENATKYSWIRGFSLLYNTGQFRATLCGMQYAQGQYIITMDDDYQHLPEEIPKLIRAAQAQPDMLCVMGDYESKQHGILRNAGSKLNQKLLSSLYGKPSEVRTSSFRIMKRELANALVAYRTAKPVLGPLIIKLTSKVISVPVQHAPRKRGTSGYSLWRLVSTTFDNVISVSTVPIRLFSVFGLGCAGASMLLGVFFFFRWLNGGIGVAGYTSQVLLIIFFGGLTLIGVGVLGEYVGRIIKEISGPEKFLIKEKTGED